MKKISVVMLIVMLALVGCSASNAPVAPEKTEYAIGETADINGMKVTVNSSRILEGSDYIQPDEGTQWIAVDFTFENTKDKSEHIAGTFELEMKDDDGRKKEYNMWGNLEGSVDSEVLSGEKLTGEMSWVVNDSDEHLYVYYKPTFSSKDSVKFIIK